MKVEFDVQVGRNDREVVTQASRQIWRCLAWHYRKQHRLRLRVDDSGKRIDCVFCGVPLVQGSDGVIDEVCAIMKRCEMEFEVYCTTNIVQVK